MLAVPFPVVPMAPTLSRPPFHRDDWIYEEKVDGHRVPLISRNAVDHTHRFRELAAAIAALRTENAVVDGEVAVLSPELLTLRS